MPHFRLDRVRPGTRTGKCWLVANTQAGITAGAFTFDLSSAPNFLAHGGAAALSLDLSGTNLYLDFLPVPEPRFGLALMMLVLPTLARGLGLRPGFPGRRGRARR